LKDRQDFRPVLKKLIAILLVLSPFCASAQELYPLSEAASTLPKGTLGVRVFSEAYKEVSQWRNMSAIRLMYGITPRLSVYMTGIASNHHGKKNATGISFSQYTGARGPLPYKFNGVHVYAKYRFLSRDGENSHFRMAGYAEGAYVHTTHHETEPDLMMGDNKGWGGGLIATYLLKKFAVSATVGGIIPASYTGDSPIRLNPYPMCLYESGMERPLPIVCPWDTCCYPVSTVTMTRPISTFTWSSGASIPGFES
jgi:hypothetical protein